jgi:muramoyltetrapeptide carboxypeptidase
VIKPRRLSPGERIAVVAPAGPVPRDGVDKGVARLSPRYRLTFDEALFTRDGYLAGDDARREKELLAAVANPEVRAIVCGRGGYGLMRILPSLRGESFVGAAKPIVGFSDITALHALLFRAGLSSVHGPTLSHLGTLAPEFTDELVALLESPAPPAAWTGLSAIAPGTATGISIGGNLELVSRLCGTPWSWPFAGNVLFLEEIGERPYRMDRSLTQIELAGAREVAAVVVGDLHKCTEPDGSGPRAADVVRERLRRWGVPVLENAPFGHGERNRPFPLGARVSVDADRGTVTFLEGAVE